MLLAQYYEEAANNVAYEYTVDSRLLLFFSNPPPHPPRCNCQALTVRSFKKVGDHWSTVQSLSQSECRTHCTVKKKKMHKKIHLKKICVVVKPCKVNRVIARVHCIVLKQALSDMDVNRTPTMTSNWNPYIIIHGILVPHRQEFPVVCLHRMFVSPCQLSDSWLWWLQILHLRNVHKGGKLSFTIKWICRYEEKMHT